MANLKTTTETWADGFGNWHARVEFEPALSVNDSRREFNLDAKWDTIRRAARRAILRELTEREQTTSETYGQAEARMRDYLKIEVETTSDRQGFGILHSVTFKEVAK